MLGTFFPSPAGRGRVDRGSERPVRGSRPVGTPLSPSPQPSPGRGEGVRSRWPAPIQARAVRPRPGVWCFGGSKSGPVPKWGSGMPVHRPSDLYSALSGGCSGPSRHPAGSLFRPKDRRPNSRPGASVTGRDLGTRPSCPTPVPGSRPPFPPPDRSEGHIGIKAELVKRSVIPGPCAALARRPGREGQWRHPVTLASAPRWPF